MNKSEQINELADALSKAQASFEGAKKDRNNPFFKSKYADLASILDAVRDAMGKNGLSFSQIPTKAEGDKIILQTLVMHKSGQWISGDYPVLVAKMDAQGLGSAITYARRYALQAMLGVAAEDDDGEAAMGRSVKQATVTGEVVKKKPVWSNEQSKEAGEIKDQIMALDPENGDRLSTDLWRRMSYDMPSDVIDALRALLADLDK
jgi:hypothetical protein